MFQVPEKFRVTNGTIRTSKADGNNGCFAVRLKSKGYNQRVFSVIASDGEDWEHVSVSLPDRCPTWGEMCAVKDLFWSDTDCVIQYHPSKADYVNNHPYCLHLWRPISLTILRPPSILVGLV